MFSLLLNWDSMNRSIYWHLSLTMVERASHGSIFTLGLINQEAISNRAIVLRYKVLQHVPRYPPKDFVYALQPGA